MSDPKCSFLANKEVLICGWMVKAPPEKKMRKKSGIAKVITYKWQRRYFVLYKPPGSLYNEFLLEYFTDEACTRKKGSIDLNNCTEIAAFDQTLPDMKVDFLLSLKTLHHKHSRIYYLSCLSESDMNEWVNYLTTVCKMVMRNEDDSHRNDLPMDVPRGRSNSRNDYDGSQMGTPSARYPSSRSVLGGSSSNLISPAGQSQQSSSAFSFDSGHYNGLPAYNRPAAAPPGGIYEQNYDVLPTSYFKDDVYQVPPAGDEHYYNTTGGAVTDSVYQIPPDRNSQSGPPLPPLPGSSAAAAGHEYINVTADGVMQEEEEDVYKVPPAHPPGRASPPPPPIPRRTLRHSFVRRKETAQQQTAAASPRQQVLLPSQQLAAQQQQQQQAHLVHHHHHHHHHQHAHTTSQTQARGTYPPASPTADQQHEYLNLWSGAGAEAEAGGGFTADNAPRNLNDVPPPMPPLPQRLRNKARSASSSSSSTSSASSSSRSSQTSSSGAAAGPHSGAVSAASRALPVPSLATLPAPLPRRSSSPQEEGVALGEARDSRDSRVSYIRAEDLVFSGPMATERNRPASLTEYNELDPLKTKALAQLAEDISKGSK